MRRLSVGIALILGAGCGAYDVALLQAPGAKAPRAVSSDAGPTDASVDSQSVDTGATDGSAAADSMVTDASPSADAAMGCQPVLDDPTCAQRCPETCNGQDDDCDGQVDEQQATDACAADHAQVACVGGACRIATCLDGYRNCDGEARTGCEVAPDDPSHCGTCGHVCALAMASATCQAGRCVVASCDTGYGDCDRDRRSCEAPLDSLTDCGGCGVVCGNLDHATAQCDQRVCAVQACVGNFGDCNVQGVDGCETPLDSLADCGACGVPCTKLGCAGGVCTAIACAPPLADCNGDGIDCETDLSTDVNHCGGCADPCAFTSASPHASPSCASQQCKPVCDPGYADCDGQFANGCEGVRTDTDSDGVEDCRDSCPLDATHTTAPCNFPGNVDTTQMSFATAPAWNCNAAGTTTIDSAAGTVSSTSCALGTPDVKNDVAQLDASAPHVMVVKLAALTVSNNHVVHLKGDKPVVFLVGGNVVVDLGGKIDADAAGTTPGAGGSIASQCGSSTGVAGASARNGKAGGGGGFGTAGGTGGRNSGSAGAVSADADLQPLRGGCSGGAANSSGGAGGGAFQISASGTVAIGHSGDTTSTTGTLSAAGGGSPGTNAGADVSSGGGGSGGGILLQSGGATTLGTSGAARAHGGGSGGGSDTTTAGANGHAADNVAAAGGTSSDGAGARGANGGLCAGASCATVSAVGANGVSGVGGGNSGGGGGGGRIRIN